MDACKVAAVARDVLLSQSARGGMTRCYLGRWLGLTPERPALCLRGFPGRPSVAALSRVSEPPGLGKR